MSFQIADPGEATQILPGNQAIMTAAEGRFNVRASESWKTWGGFGTPHEREHWVIVPVP
ncbi:MAG: hypothetical protein GY946_05275 [bacterium]|nr:hypothetical protein [bacterium]